MWRCYGVMGPYSTTLHGWKLIGFLRASMIFQGLPRPSSIIHRIPLRSGYQQKDRKPSQNDKTEHGMEKTVQNQGQSPKNAKVRVNTEESAVKPEPELKNTIGCNLNPSDGPGKPNSISMKTVKTLKAQMGPQSISNSPFVCN
ncbi:hypothetical protein Tco_0828490 [Tanacetum coccineum]